MSSNYNPANGQLLLPSSAAMPRSGISSRVGSPRHKISRHVKENQKHNVKGSQRYYSDTRNRLQFSKHRHSKKYLAHKQAYEARNRHSVTITGQGSGSAYYIEKDNRDNNSAGLTISNSAVEHGTIKRLSSEEGYLVRAETKESDVFPNISTNENVESNSKKLQSLERKKQAIFGKETRSALNRSHLGAVSSNFSFRMKDEDASDFFPSGCQVYSGASAFEKMQQKNAGRSIVDSRETYYLKGSAEENVNSEDGSNSNIKDLGQNTEEQELALLTLKPREKNTFYAHPDSSEDETATEARGAVIESTGGSMSGKNVSVKNKIGKRSADVSGGTGSEKIVNIMSDSNINSSSSVENELFSSTGDNNYFRNDENTEKCQITIVSPQKPSSTSFSKATRSISFDETSINQKKMNRENSIENNMSSENMSYEKHDYPKSNFTYLSHTLRTITEKSFFTEKTSTRSVSENSQRSRNSSNRNSTRKKLSQVSSQKNARSGESHLYPPTPASVASTKNRSGVAKSSSQKSVKSVRSSNSGRSFKKKSPSRDTEFGRDIKESTNSGWGTKIGNAMSSKNMASQLTVALMALEKSVDDIGESISSGIGFDDDKSDTSKKHLDQEVIPQDSTQLPKSLSGSAVSGSRRDGSEMELLISSFKMESTAKQSSPSSEDATDKFPQNDSKVPGLPPKSLPPNFKRMAGLQSESDKNEGRVFWDKDEEQKPPAVNKSKSLISHSILTNASKYGAKGEANLQKGEGTLLRMLKSEQEAKEASRLLLSVPAFIENDKAATNIDYLDGSPGNSEALDYLNNGRPNEQLYLPTAPVNDRESHSSASGNSAALLLTPGRTARSSNSSNKSSGQNVIPMLQRVEHAPLVLADFASSNIFSANTSSTSKKVQSSTRSKIQKSQDSKSSSSKQFLIPIPAPNKSLTSSQKSSHLKKSSLLGASLMRAKSNGSSNGGFSRSMPNSPEIRAVKFPRTSDEANRLETKRNFQYERISSSSRSQAKKYSHENISNSNSTSNSNSRTNRAQSFPANRLLLKAPDQLLEPVSSQSPVSGGSNVDFPDYKKPGNSILNVSPVSKSSAKKNSENEETREDARKIMDVFAKRESFSSSSATSNNRSFSSSSPTTKKKYAHMLKTVEQIKREKGSKATEDTNLFVKESTNVFNVGSSARLSDSGKKATSSLGTKKVTDIPSNSRRQILSRSVDSSKYVGDNARNRAASGTHREREESKYADVDENHKKRYSNSLSFSPSYSRGKKSYNDAYYTPRNLHRCSAENKQYEKYSHSQSSRSELSREKRRDVAYEKKPSRDVHEKSTSSKTSSTSKREFGPSGTTREENNSSANKTDSNSQKTYVIRLPSKNQNNTMPSTVFEYPSEIPGVNAPDVYSEYEAKEIDKFVPMIPRRNKAPVHVESETSEKNEG